MNYCYHFIVYLQARIYTEIIWFRTPNNVFPSECVDRLCKRSSFASPRFRDEDNAKCTNLYYKIARKDVTRQHSEHNDYCGGLATNNPYYKLLTTRNTHDEFEYGPTAALVGRHAVVVVLVVALVRGRADGGERSRAPPHYRPSTLSGPALVRRGADTTARPRERSETTRRQGGGGGSGGGGGHFGARVQCGAASYALRNAAEAPRYWIRAGPPDII